MVVVVTLLGFPIALIFLPLLLTFVIGLVFDIDHALQGVIGLSQQPLLELKENLSK